VKRKRLGEGEQIIGHTNPPTPTALLSLFARQKRRRSLACGMESVANRPMDQWFAPLPGWLGRDAPLSEADAAFRAGATLALLDARVRAEVPFAGVWRRRLAP
jgi:hypothetical protein